MTEEEAKRALGSMAPGDPQHMFVEKQNPVRVDISLPEGVTEEEIRKALEMMESGNPVYIPLAADLEEGGTKTVIARETDEEAAKAFIESIQPPQPQHAFARKKK